METRRWRTPTIRSIVPHQARKLAALTTKALGVLLMNREIRALTGLRGVAATYVMVFHYFPGLQMTGPVSAFLAHGYLMVDLFFVLSGYVMAMTYASDFSSAWTASTYFHFLGRRVARIYPLCLALTIVAFLLATAGFLKIPDSAPPYAMLATNVAMVQAWGLTECLDGPTWSLSAEWAAYLLFPAILWATLSHSAARAWATSAIAAAVIIALCAVPQPFGRQLTPLSLLDLHNHVMALPVIRCLAEFSLGVLAFRVGGTATGAAFVRRAGVAAGLAAVLIALLAVPRADAAVALLFPALVLSLTVPHTGAAKLLSAAIPSFLGRISYSIYLVHELMTTLLEKMHGLAAWLGLPHAQTVAAAGCIGMTIAAAWIAYNLIELPGRRYIRNLIERPRARNAPRNA
jgi:peptidoglycan/LPS O-acetylase OafA/YrhL